MGCQSLQGYKHLLYCNKGFIVYFIVNETCIFLPLLSELNKSYLTTEVIVIPSDESKLYSGNNKEWGKGIGSLVVIETRRFLFFPGCCG